MLSEKKDWGIKPGVQDKEELEQRFRHGKILFKTINKSRSRI